VPYAEVMYGTENGNKSEASIPVHFPTILVAEMIPNSITTAVVSDKFKFYNWISIAWKIVNFNSTFNKQTTSIAITNFNHCL